jgi:hypothetical protein
MDLPAERLGYDILPIDDFFRRPFRGAGLNGKMEFTQNI